MNRGREGKVCVNKPEWSYLTYLLCPCFPSPILLFFFSIFSGLR